MFGLGVKKISIGELAEKLAEGKQTLIDVREPHEFRAGHVPGAVNIPLATLPSRLGAFRPEQTIYVICHSGSRSATAVAHMKRAGFEHAYSVTGGTSAWRGKLAR